MSDVSPATGQGLVVFDFDHTLYDGDSGAHMVAWLVKRHAWRKALALLAAPLLLPMVAWLPTRRRGISGFLWIGTVGARRPIEALIDAYVAANAPSIRARLLAPALAVLHRHRLAGDEVVVATGAPPELARAILDFVAHQDLPVVGSLGHRLMKRQVLEGMQRVVMNEHADGALIGQQTGHVFYNSCHALPQSLPLLRPILIKYRRHLTPSHARCVRGLGAVSARLHLTPG